MDPLSAIPIDEYCPRCDATGPETYWYMREEYLFDVDLAREFVGDGRAPIEVDEDSLRYSVRKSVIVEQHVAHVNPQYPGIIAHVFYTTEEGEELHGHLLIDGNHRAARALELKQPFSAYLLSEDESREILLRHPASRL